MKGFLLTFFLVLTIIFGAVIAKDMSVIKSQRQEVAALKLEIYELKQACKLAEILRQILPPVAKDELSLLAEKLKQEKDQE